MTMRKITLASGVDLGAVTADLTGMESPVVADASDGRFYNLELACLVPNYVRAGAGNVVVTVETSPDGTNWYQFASFGFLNATGPKVLIVESGDISFSTVGQLWPLVRVKLSSVANSDDNTIAGTLQVVLATL